MTSVMIDYFNTYQSLYRKELDDWMQARTYRRAIVNPTTIHIQQLYQDSLIDVFLRRQIEQRILRVTNRNIVIKDKDGKIDSDRSAMFQSKVIRTIIKKAMESKFFGYSLLYVEQWQPGQIIKLREIPRGNVIPETGMLLKNAYNPGEGIRYEDYPNFLLFSSLGDNTVGYLENISPLTILKRHSWASWDEFEQMFGVPLRIAKTMVTTPEHLSDLSTFLESMGSTGHMVLPKTDELEVLQSTQTDSFGVFNEKRKAINEEIAIGISGQTMTSMQGSSRSQSETHLKTLDEITADDIQDVLDYLGNELIPILRNLGYDIPDGHVFDLMSRTNISILDKSKIDEILLTAGYRLDQNYIQETYDVVLDKDTPVVLPTPQNNKALDFFVDAPII